MARRIIEASLLVIAGLSAVPVARAGFVQVDLSPYANTRIQNYQPSAAGYPEGHVILGGIPFNIQTVGGNNAWNAEVVSGPYPHILDIPLSVSNATEVQTLINTFYGQPGPTSYITLEFFGTGGAYFRKDLIGNVDVRDHFFAFWTNTINGTSTTNVYSSGGGFLSESRLDKQQIVLPSIFHGGTLTEFRLTSTGGVLISDASIQGLTIMTSAVPEPSCFVLLGTGVLGLVGYGWRRRRQAGSGRQARGVAPISSPRAA
jgi:PEP-CTERM motif